jgi:hypothetical protein
LVVAAAAAEWLAIKKSEPSPAPSSLQQQISDDFKIQDTIILVVDHFGAQCQKMRKCAASSCEQ